MDKLTLLLKLYYQYLNTYLTLLLAFGRLTDLVRAGGPQAFWGRNADEQSGALSFGTWSTPHSPILAGAEQNLGNRIWGADRTPSRESVNEQLASRRQSIKHAEMPNGRVPWLPSPPMFHHSLATWMYIIQTMVDILTVGCRHLAELPISWYPTVEI